MSDTNPAKGSSELLLALPEFVLMDAYIDDNDELVAQVELPRGCQTPRGMRMAGVSSDSRGEDGLL